MTTTSEDLLKRITARPDVFNGKPIIRDMRISVELILSLLSQGASQEELKDDYPDLEEEDILACIAYAHAVIAGDSLAQAEIQAALMAASGKASHRSGAAPPHSRFNDRSRHPCFKPGPSPEGQS